MDFKINREILGTNEVIYDGMQEQSVELDYILPDYYPDIFKLIKCQLFPRIISSNVSGDKVTYELIVGIKIMYCSEQNSAIQCVEQKLNYSKTVDLGKSCDKPVVTLNTKTDYVNCRAVNQRRIDLRGAVTTKVKAICEQKQEAVSDAFGMNIQLKKKPVNFASSKLYCSKRITITEDFDLGFSKPAVKNIIRCDAVISGNDKKVISNKLITKGEAHISMLYSCEKDGTSTLEAMQFTMPYSQIMDMEGVDEKYECFIDVSVVSCEMMPKENSDGENKILECEMIILINCTAIKNTSVNIVTDAYSTAYLCEYKKSKARIEKSPVPMSDTMMTKATITYNDGSIDCIYDVWCKAQTISTRMNFDDKKIMVMGNVSYCVMAKNSDGMPMMLETDQPFEYSFKMNELSEGCLFDASACVMSCSYSLVSTNSVEVKAELKVSGNYYETAECTVLSDIIVDESNPKHADNNCAVKLYYADEGEDIWEIAKKYSTSINAIMEENNFSDEKISERSMMLIPMIG